MSAARLGYGLAAATLLVDQASKLVLLFAVELPLHQPIVVGPFLDLIAVWNRGVSYGLLQQSTEIGRWLFVGVALAATVLIGFWLRRTAKPLIGAALGLIAGGALGNAIDRAAYGAVFDFAHAHFGSHSWYVFNLADAAIVAGVVGLVYDALWPGGHSSTATDSLIVEPPHEGLK